MNNKKYEILMDKENTIECEGHILHRIKALRDFNDVREGDLGGYVEKENNLSHYGNCWIYDNAKAMDDSRLYGNSIMYGDSRLYGNSAMYDNSRMYGNSEMYGNSLMYDCSKMYDNSAMHGDSLICDGSEMHNNSKIYDNSEMHNNSKMYGNSEMYDNSRMYGKSVMYNNSEMHDKSVMCGYSELNNKAKLYGKLISKVDDFIEIQNPEGRLVTCVRKGNKIFYNVGCQNEIDEQTFKNRIENEGGGLEENPHREYYYKIIEASKILLLNK